MGAVFDSGGMAQRRDAAALRLQSFAKGTHVLRREPGCGVKIEVYPSEPIDSICRRFKKATRKSEIPSSPRAPLAAAAHSDGDGTG
jgi:hypothetical protein